MDTAAVQGAGTNPSTASDPLPGHEGMLLVPGIVYLVAIGPTTERALREAGLPCHAVAKQPSAEGLAAALSGLQAGEG